MYLLFSPPPHNESVEYSGYINSSKDVEVDRLLDQPAEKRSSIRKEIFIKGRQETLEDVITFIANINVFARFWIKMDNDTQPLLIQLLNETADFYLLQSINPFMTNSRSVKCICLTLLSLTFLILFQSLLKWPRLPK